MSSTSQHATRRWREGLILGFGIGAAVWMIPALIVFQISGRFGTPLRTQVHRPIEKRIELREPFVKSVQVHNHQRLL